MDKQGQKETETTGNKGIRTTNNEGNEAADNKLTTVENKREDVWKQDPGKFLLESFNQFCSIVTMAAFVGGIQLAFIAFMNDITPLRPQSPEELLKDTWTNEWDHPYTVQTFGLMVGVVGVTVSMGAGAIASVNAALICYYSVSPPAHQPKMEGYILFCMLLIFGSFGFSAVSAVLLCTKFDIPFTVTIAILSWTVIIAGVVQVERQVKRGREVRGGWVRKLAKDWKGIPYVLIALAVYLIDLIKPSTSSWPTMAAFYCTVGFYVMESWFNAKRTQGEKDVQHSGTCQDAMGKESERVENLENGMKPQSGQGGGTGRKKEHGRLHMPKGIQASCLTVLVLFWAACGAIKLAWRLHDSDSPSVIPYALLGLSGLEVIWLGILAAQRWYNVWAK